MEDKKQHGGARPGSGRKTRYEKTKVLRVPDKYIPAIKALIEHLDATEYVCDGYQAEKSMPIFLRSLKDKKQHISFVTEPFKPE